MEEPIEDEYGMEENSEPEVELTDRGGKTCAGVGGGADGGADRG